MEKTLYFIPQKIQTSYDTERGIREIIRSSHLVFKQTNPFSEKTRQKILFESERKAIKVEVLKKQYEEADLLRQHWQRKKARLVRRVARANKRIQRIIDAIVAIDMD